MNKRLALLFLALLFVVGVVTAQVAQYTKDVSSSVTNTPTLTNYSTNYSAGDTVGDLMTVTNIFNTSPGSGELLVVGVADDGGEGKSLNVIIFHTQPTDSFTDNSTADIGDDDILKIACVVPVTQHYPFNDNGFSQGIQYGCVLDSSAASFYALAIAQESTYQYDSNDALTFIFNSVKH